MKRILTIVSLLIVALVVLNACGGSAPPPTASKASPPTSAPAATVALQPTAIPAQPTAAPTATKPPATAVPATKSAATLAPTEDVLPAPKAGSLKSFTSQLEFKNEVLKPAPTVVEMWTVAEMRYRVEPAPLTFAMTSTDKTGKMQEAMQIIQTGPDTYMRLPGEGKWMKITGAGGGLGELAATMITPDKLTESAPADVFTQANVVGRNETVDSVATTHYRIKDAKLQEWLKQSDGMDPGDKLVSGQVDFWVANRGGYLKQYTSETVTERSDGRQVKGSARMLVTGENKPVTITLPPADQIMALPGVGGNTVRPTAAATVKPPAGAAATAKPPANAAAQLAALPVPPQSRELKPDEALPEAVQVISELTDRGGQQRRFVSDATPEEIALFYAEQMAKLGYLSIQNQAGMADAPINAYVRGKEGIQFVVTPDDESGKSYVFLQVMAN